jgi:hypothetical protein
MKKEALLLKIKEYQTAAVPNLNKKNSNLNKARRFIHSLLCKGPTN